MTRLAVIVLVLGGASTGAAQSSRTHLVPGVSVLTGVHVVPMDRDTVLRDVDVLVRDGRIAAIGRRLAVPAGARRIVGGGRYLMPGLADMHAHLYADEYVADSVAPHELGVFLANGVTAARLMIGTPVHLDLRKRIGAGTLTGPGLWIASPQFAGRADPHSRVVTTAAQARAAVREVAGLGYDFVKLTVLITPDVYDAVVDEARQAGIRVIGHVDPRVGVPKALEAGQQIEHFDGYWESMLADLAPIRQSVSDVGVYYPRNWQSLDWIDDGKLARLVGATARAGVAVTPTHTFFVETFAEPVPDSVVKARPDWAHIPPKMRDLYWNGRQRYWANPPSAARRARYVEVRRKLLTTMVDSGGTILAGSDAPGGLLGYGWTLHRELEHFVRSGLSPYQALRTATVNPAGFLKADADIGTVTVGRRADLVLVEGNPLADIRNTARIGGVMVGGRWLERPELDRLIAEAGRRLNP
ncbi:MAG: amidohydrolase family protein [Gemmatimonadales bacterium]|nr:amidohydrolase family protein [Gemmatimonadales bacterium]